MKRIALIAALLLGGIAAAQADNDIYNNTRKVDRGDFELHADTSACDQEYGAPKNGTVTSRAYKRCMLLRVGGSPTPCARSGRRPGPIRKPV